MREGVSRKAFVRLGTLLGVGAAASSVLAACGAGPGAPSGGGGPEDGSGAGARGEKAGGGSAGPRDGRTGGRAEHRDSDARTIARASGVRPGAAVRFEDPGGNPAVLVRLRGGDLVAYTAVCSHEGCTVAYKDGRLVCPCHGSVFDPANNGRVVRGPARLPLRKVRIAVEGGDVVRL